MHRTNTIQYWATLPLLAVLGCAGSSASTPVPAATAQPVAPTKFDPPFFPVPANVPDPPTLRPSGMSDDRFPITTNAYGAFGTTPNAPELGDKAEDFKIALASGGTFDLGEARAAGPVLLMFYRGFW